VPRAPDEAADAEAGQVDRPGSRPTAEKKTVSLGSSPVSDQEI
jgi:hypothetical protein